MPFCVVTMRSGFFVVIGIMAWLLLLLELWDFFLTGDRIERLGMDIVRVRL